jgi:hypothetical protein
MSYRLHLQPKQSEKEETHVVSDEMASQISEAMKQLPNPGAGGLKAFHDSEGNTLFINIGEYRSIMLIRRAENR